MKRSLFLAGMGLAIWFSVGEYAQADAPSSADTAGHATHAPRTRAEVEARVKARFAALDANHDGFITPDELLHRGMHPGGPDAGHKERADRLFAMMDTDRNGVISKAEFEAFHASHALHGPGGPGRFARWGGPHRGGMWMMRMHREMMARRMFEREDANHDGKISLAEAEKAALDRFDRIDTNHDGVISEAERDAARQQMAERFHQWRERRWGSGWGHHGDGDAPPPPAGAAPAPQG